MTERPAAPLLAATVLSLAVACGSAEPEPNEPTAETTTVADDGSDDDATAEREPAPAEPQDAPNGPETFEARIVSEGPIGDGRCIQKSYEVERDGGAREWVHFERCQGEPDGPMFDALEVGRTYRFTVERGASPNFADAAMITGAEPL